jgi:hypothetical protein
MLRNGMSRQATLRMIVASETVGMALVPRIAARGGVRAV